MVVGSWLGAVGCVATGDWLGLSLLRRAPGLPAPLAAARSMGEVVLVGVEEADAVVAMDEGVAGAMELSEAGDTVLMAGGGTAVVPFDLAAGWLVGPALLLDGC